MPKNMILTLDQINKNYGSQEVLKNLSLQVQAGESLAITGPSGCGKTTLLNLIGGLDKPDSGMLLFENRNVSEMSENELAQFRNQKIGFVFQQHYLLPQCTLWENILLPTLANPHTNKERANKHAEELLHRLSLSHCKEKKPTQMSVGECQRGAFIRALINHPTLLLADEPTGSLDEDAAEHLSDELLNLNREYGTTLIAVTHSPALANKMNTIYQLKNASLT